jgi:hypothetical protein
MDCKNARLLLEFIHPGSAELDAAEAEALHQHLGECPDCAAQAREERRADEHLGRAMRDVPVPAGLRERVLKRLTVERDAAHRRLLVRGVVAAAALFVAGWLGYSWWFGGLSAVDGNAVHAVVNGQPFSSPGDVEKGFASMGVTTVVPSRYEFNYDLLDSYGLAALPGYEGKLVPHLLFKSRPAGNGLPLLAHVYILSSRQFDLAKTRKNGVTFASGTYRVMLEDYGQVHYLYVIAHTGEELKPFQPRRSVQ